MFTKKSLFQKIITVLLAAVLLTAVSVLTAAADAGVNAPNVVENGDLPGQGVPASPDPGLTPQDGGNQNVDPNPGDNGIVTPDGGDNGDNTYEQPTVYSNDELREQFVEQYNEYYNSIDDLNGENSQYKPNENLNDLPTVSAGEVIEATAEPLPDVAVSDATLFSGIVMWLCVAVGISVVAGVMVSKRTHRRGV